MLGVNMVIIVQWMITMAIHSTEIIIYKITILTKITEVSMTLINLAKEKMLFLALMSTVIRDWMNWMNFY